MDERIKQVSDETKERISELEVALPSVYTSIFGALARRYGVEVEEELCESPILDAKVHEYTLLHENTSRNVDRLSRSTSKAVDAIALKSDALLQEVLAETLALREEIDALRNAVYEDALTGVHNRKWFVDTLLHEDGVFAVSGVLGLIDMNDFKGINDTFGHAGGDKVLIYIAAQLRSSGHPVVRYGGDEFLVVFGEAVSEEGAFQSLGGILDTVVGKTLKIRDQRFKTSFAFGVASFRAGDGAEAALDRADRAMYEAKQRSKGG